MPTHESICILGAAGMLGRELVRTCQQRLPNHRLHPLTRTDVDITDAAAVDEVIGRLSPCVVMNAAAYTDVDGCETNQDLAWLANVRGPANLARSCQAHHCRLVHVSTDFVFDGCKASPYLPEDPINPLSVYGRTKAQGERRIRDQLDDYAIIRTSWLFASHGKNFVKTMLRLADERDELQVVDDQIGCPTYAPDLAEAIVTMATSGKNGTYHFCNSGSCSWHGFATEIVQESGKRVTVRPISSFQLSRLAVRPAYSVLSTHSFERETGLVPRHWHGALLECLGLVETVNPV